MPYDDALVARVRMALGSRADLVEKKMFGGLTFMLRGHMCCGVTGRDLMVRVGPEGYHAAVARPGARPMDFTGKPLRGFVFVSSEGIAADDRLREWVRQGVGFASSLPPK